MPNIKVERRSERDSKANLDDDAIGAQPKKPKTVKTEDATNITTASENNLNPDNDVDSLSAIIIDSGAPPGISSERQPSKHESSEKSGEAPKSNPKETTTTSEPKLNPPPNKPPRKRVVTGVARAPTAALRKFNTSRYTRYQPPPPTPVSGRFTKYENYDNYHLFINPTITNIKSIPTSGVRLDDLTVSKVMVGEEGMTASLLNKSWPAEFDMEGMIRATRMPLGYAAKIWVRVGDVDVDGQRIEFEEEEGWYYLWWGGIHILCGKEGLDHGVYMIRPSFEQLRGGLGWKKSARCVVQAGPGLETL